jgi:hypothetical protein
LIKPLTNRLKEEILLRVIDARELAKYVKMPLRTWDVKTKDPEELLT